MKEQDKKMVLPKLDHGVLLPVIVRKRGEGIYQKKNENFT